MASSRFKVSVSKTSFDIQDVYRIVGGMGDKQLVAAQVDRGMVESSRLVVVRQINCAG